MVDGAFVLHPCTQYPGQKGCRPSFPEHVDAVSTGGVREETILFRVGVAGSDATSVVAVTVGSTVASLVQAEHEVEKMQSYHSPGCKWCLLA